MIVQDKHTKFINEHPKEWPIFQATCRRFADNQPSQEYGMLKYGAEEKEENMIYGATPSEVRLKHVEYLMANKKLAKELEKL